MANKEILNVEGLRLIYQTPEDETEAIADVSFTVEEGEFVSLVGPSGCGKTTVLSIAAGLMQPTAGRVTLDGSPVTGPRADVGYMLQRDSLFEWRTIEKNVLLGLDIQKKRSPENDAYALSLLDKYGLKDFGKHFPHQLSGGMRQRVALIRTLAFKPKILLLDEPFSALDFQTRLSVCDDVHAIIRKERLSALLVTHDISEAVSLADKIIVLSPRPARVKQIYAVDIDKPTPLARREDARFSAWFDRIWKEVSV